MKHRFTTSQFCLTIAAFAVLLVSAGTAVGQNGINSSGTDFWLGFMPNGAGMGNTSVYEELFITSPTDNRVTIAIPGVGMKTILLTAGQVSDYSLTNFMTYVPEVATDNAIHISSMNPITVYGFSAWGDPQGIGDSPDGFLALPSDALGTEYYTVNFPDNGVFAGGIAPFLPGEFLITSPYDDNVITITPAADTKTGRKAGVPWTDTLMKGQTYLVQSAGTSWGQNDLTGTLIKSSKPISVLTGHQISSVPSDECCSADNLFEMIPSVDKWGTQYFDMPMAGKTVAGDYIRLLSAQDGNTIAYGDTSVTLNSGEYADILNVTSPTVFTSTNHKRFIVALYAYSQGYLGDPGYSDPFMVLFTPKEQFEKEMFFRTPTSSRGAFTNYLTVVALNDSISRITINGLPISAYPSAGQAVFPGTNPQMGARRILLDAKPYAYTAKGSAPFAMYQYGYSDYSGYGWPTGMAQRITNSTDSLPPLALSDSSCGSFAVELKDARPNDTRIAGVGLITSTGDVRWSTPSKNFELVFDTAFTAGNSTASFHLNVIDPTQNGYAAVWTTDRAGNDTVYQYFYTAPSWIPASGTRIDFGNVLLGSDSCLVFQFTNRSSFRLLIESRSLTGTDTMPFSGLSSMSPISVEPGTSFMQRVCAAASDTMNANDTLTLTIGCAEFRYPLNVNVVTPLIDASDVDFGTVPVGDTVCKSVTIRNPGKAPLVIYPSALLKDTVNFSILAALPVTIFPGGSVILNVCFHPRTSGSIQLPIGWPTNIDTPYQNSTKDTSLLSGVGSDLSVPQVAQRGQLTLSLTPNPATEATAISLQGAPSANVEIFDVLGHEVASFRVAGSYQWRMGALPAGTYIVRAEASGTLASRRFVKR